MTPAGLNSLQQQGVHFSFRNALEWTPGPTERVSDISGKLDFWWSIPQKGIGIGHLGAWDDQTIRISRFFNEMRLLRSLRPLRLLRPLRSLRLQRFQGLENHYWGLLSHPGIWIQLYFYVLKKIFFGYYHKISYWILAPFLLEAVEASQCHLIENWLMKHKCPILLNLLCIIIRYNYWSFYPPETFTLDHSQMRHQKTRYLTIFYFC